MEIHKLKIKIFTGYYCGYRRQSILQVHQNAAVMISVVEEYGLKEDAR